MSAALLTYGTIAARDAEKSTGKRLFWIIDTAANPNQSFNLKRFVGPRAKNMCHIALIVECHYMTFSTYGRTVKTIARFFGQPAAAILSAASDDSSPRPGNAVNALTTISKSGGRIRAGQSANTTLDHYIRSHQEVLLGMEPERVDIAEIDDPILTIYRPNRWK